MTKIYRPLLLIVFSFITIGINFLLLFLIYPQLDILHLKHSNNENIAVSDTIVTDTIAVEEPPKEFVTQDLRTLFLKGHVKEVIMLSQMYDQETSMPLDEYEPSGWYEFDSDGNLKSYRTQYYKTKIKRNSKGQVISMEEYPPEEVSSGMSFKYNSDSYPKYYSECCGDTYEEEYNTYNDEHWPIKGKAGEGMPRAIFSYPDIDDQGNWTTKEITIKFSEVFEGEDDETRTVKRRIKYYE